MAVTENDTTADLAGMRRVGSAIPLGEYFRMLWQHRAFTAYLPINNLRTQNRDTVLGNFWHLANPATQIAIYYIIFGVILGATGGTKNYFVFLTIGIFTFTFIQKTVMDASTCLTRNEGVIRSIYFPRAVLPISVTIGQTIAYIPTLVVLFVTLILTGETPAPRWLAFIPILGLTILLNLGLSLLTARAAYEARDLTQILPHIFRVGMYFSGAFFDLRSRIDSEFLLALFNLNPAYPVITLSRWSLLGDPVDLLTVVSAFVWSIVAVLFGFRYFKKAENTYGG